MGGSELITTRMGGAGKNFESFSAVLLLAHGKANRVRHGKVQERAPQVFGPDFISLLMIAAVPECNHHHT